MESPDREVPLHPNTEVSSVCRVQIERFHCTYIHTYIHTCREDSKSTLFPAIASTKFCGPNCRSSAIHVCMSLKLLCKEQTKQYSHSFWLLDLADSLHLDLKALSSGSGILFLSHMQQCHVSYWKFAPKRNQLIAEGSGNGALFLSHHNNATLTPVSYWKFA